MINLVFLALGVVVTSTSLAVLFGWARTADPLRAADGLVAGALLLEFAITQWPTPTPERALRRGIVAGAVLVGLFWSFSIYAQRTGERVAESLVVSPHGMATATVLSAEDLGLKGPGITVTKSSSNTAFPYRYEGLRLFIFRNGRWFLLPAGWRNDATAAAIILSDNEKIRVELRG